MALADSCVWVPTFAFHQVLALVKGTSWEFRFPTKTPSEAPHVHDLLA